MNIRLLQFLKVLFYSAVSILLVGFAIFSIVQGILMQGAGDFRMALIFYYVAALSGATMFWTYLSARRAFSVLK